MFRIGQELLRSGPKFAWANAVLQSGDAARAVLGQWPIVVPLDVVVEGLDSISRKEVWNASHPEDPL